MRHFRTVEDIARYAEQQAVQAREAQRRYQRALALLDEGFTRAQVAKRFGFKPDGKTGVKVSIASEGGRAAAYEDIALAFLQLAKEEGGQA